MQKIIISDNFRLKSFHFYKDSNTFFLAINLSDYIFLSSRTSQKQIKFIEDFIDIKLKKKIISERSQFINNFTSLFNNNLPNISYYDQNYYYNFIDLYITSKYLVKILIKDYKIEIYKDFFSSQSINHANINRILVDQIFKYLKYKNIKFVYEFDYKNNQLLSNFILFLSILKKNIKNLIFHHRIKYLSYKNIFFIINFREISRFKNFINYKKNLKILNVCDSFLRDNFYSHKLYLKINFIKSFYYFFSIVKIFFFKKTENKVNEFFKLNRLYLPRLSLRWTYYYNYFINCNYFFKINKISNELFSTNLNDVEIVLANNAAKNNSFNITAVPHSPYDLILYKPTFFDKIISYSDAVSYFYKLNGIKEKNIIKMYNINFSKRYKFSRFSSNLTHNEILIFTDFTSFYQSEFNLKNLILLLNKVNKQKKNISIKLHPLLKENILDFRKIFPNINFTNIFDDPLLLIRKYKKIIFISSSIISGIDLIKNNKKLKKKIFSLNLNPLLHKSHIKFINSQKIKKINKSDLLKFL
jgi:hypothetical protein